LPVEVVRTLRASGGDYTSIQAWDNAEARDLVSADEIAVLECYNDWPGGLNGRFSSSDSSWVCDTDHYPWIRSAPGSGTSGPNHHGGIPGAGFVAYSTSNTYDAFQFGTKFRITGLEFRFAGSNTTLRAIYDKVKSTGWILEEVITVGPAEFHASSRVAGAGYVRNVLHIKTAPGGNLLTGRAASNPVYNSTFVAIEGANNGIHLNYDNFSISVTNSVFVGATNDRRADLSASIFTVQNCATTNSEGMSNFPGTGHVYGINPGTAFVDALEWDFRLSENSPLRGAGADLSHLFDIDIAGNTRGDSWDIGAFQRVDGGGGPISDTALFDLKATVQLAASTDVDLKAAIEQKDQTAFDLMARVMSSDATPFDLKAAIRSADVSFLDCLASIVVTGEGMALVDLRTLIRSAAEANFDLLSHLYALRAETFDLRAHVASADLVAFDMGARVRSASIAAIDLMTILGTEVIDPLDLLATVKSADAEGIDLLVQISGAATELLDLRARIADAIGEDFDLSATVMLTDQNALDMRVVVGDDGRVDLDLRAAIVTAVFVEGNILKIYAPKRPYQARAMKRRYDA